MTEETLVGQPAERRSEIRENLEQLRNVELKLPWNIPETLLPKMVVGLFVLVK